MANIDTTTPKTNKRPPRVSYWQILRDNPKVLRYSIKSINELGMMVMPHAEHIAILPGTQSDYYVYSVEAFQHILSTNADNYNKDDIAYHRLVEGIGLGLITNDGNLWKRHRKILQPLFTRSNYAKYAEQYVDLTLEQMQDWDKYCKGVIRRPMNITPHMNELALKIAIVVFMSGTAIEHLKLILHASYLGQRYIATSVFMHPWYPSIQNIRYRYKLRKFDKIILDIISKRRNNPETVGSDMLSLMVAAKTEAGVPGLDDQEILDEVKTMMMAGYITSGSTFAWIWYYLAKNPECQAKVFAEVDAVLGSRRATYDDMEKLVYCRMVVEETLRLLPPVSMNYRHTIRRDTVCGLEIPRDARLTLSTYTLHHNPRYWSNPEKFDPERFSPENRDNIVKFSYIPFGAGPRTCIAHQLVIVEAVMVLATVAQRYKLVLPLEHDEVGIKMILTLQPDRDIHMRVVKRH